MNEQEWIRTAVRERLLNRAAIREHAITMAEERLRTDKARRPRRLVLAADLLLLALAVGLFLAITGKHWLPAGETTLPTTPAMTTPTTRETTLPTTTAATTPQTSGTLAGEPETQRIAKGGIAAFQLSLWNLAGKPASGYPEYYAGAYFEHPMSYMSTLYDDEFTILVTCEPSLVEHDLWRAVNQAEGIPYNLMPMTIIQVEHSYNELLIQYNAVLDRMSDPPATLAAADRDLLVKIGKVGIDEKRNEVYVEVPIGTTGVAEALDRALAGADGYAGVDAVIRVYEVTEMPSTEEIYEITRTFLSGLGLQVIPNTGVSPGERIRLPESFESVEGGYPIGEFFRERNERSIQNGMDFSAFLGKDVLLHGYVVSPISGVDTPRENIYLVIGSGEVVGYWFWSPSIDPADPSVNPTDDLILMRYLEGGSDHYNR